MQEYDGLTEADLKIIQIALSKLQITGAEAYDGKSSTKNSNGD